jgi:SAM-dependent methyltransferase
MTGAGDPTGAPRTGSPGAFDPVAEAYDATFSDTELGRRLRLRAWARLDRAFGPGETVLELGCGTGIDAVHLAGRGVRVIATDASPRMLALTDERVVLHHANDLVRTALLDLARVGDRGWADAVLAAGPGGAGGEVAGRGRAGPVLAGAFSDFGAIDCVPDRRRVLAGLADVLRPGSRVILVAMTPICPWEIAWHLAHGEVRAAARRWRAGAVASLGRGATTRVWYPSAARVAHEAAPWFAATRAEGIGVALPPAGLATAMERRPGLLRSLTPLERLLGPSALGARLSDHWLLELVRRGS